MLTVNAGPNQHIIFDGVNVPTFQLAGSAEDDTYSITGYEWEVLTRSFDIGNVGPTAFSDGYSPTSTVQVKQLSATYNLRLHVTNSNGDVASDDIVLRADTGVGNLGEYITYSLFGKVNKIRNTVYPTMIEGVFPYASMFNTLVFTTTTDVIGVRLRASLNERLFYKVDGVVTESNGLIVTSDGDAEVSLNLGNPGVLKTIELIPNAYGGVLTQLFAAYIVAILHNSSDTITVLDDPNPTGGILFFGDSILGTNTTGYGTLSAMPILLRDTYNQLVTTDAYGGRGLVGSVAVQVDSDYVLDAATRQATLDRWIAKNPDILYFEIGSNDWGYLADAQTWITSDYIAAAVSILTAFHAAVPACQIYWQSPVYRQDNSINPDTGISMVSFRSDIQAAAATMEFVTYIDGLPLIDPEHFQIDDLHPDTDGHLQYVQSVASILGLVAGNFSPSVNAGVNKEITLPTNSVSVTGTGSDTDGTIASILWSQLSGPNTAGISAPSSFTTLFTGLIEGTYTFRLSVTDNEEAVSHDSMQVIVHPEETEEPPVPVIVRGFRAVMSS